MKLKHKRPVIAIGVFDGVHRGHKRVIQEAIKRAHVIGTMSIVMTFSPHPTHVLKPRRHLWLLVSPKKRMELIKNEGIDKCIVLRFTKQFSRMTHKQFVMNYLASGINPREVFVGENFRFGKDRKGTVDFLKNMGLLHGFRVKIVASKKSGKHTISSTKIRTLISSGEIDTAARLLGRPVFISGKVSRGKKMGRLLGFPTVNINSFDTIIPPCGVYATKVIVNKKKFWGMTNIGHRPSFNRKKDMINAETHILNFKRNVYGKEIEIQLIKRIRDEKEFCSPKDFITQLEKDKKEVEKILKNI